MKTHMIMRSHTGQGIVEGFVIEYMAKVLSTPMTSMDYCRQKKGQEQMMCDGSRRRGMTLLIQDED